jgi:golgi phosphoprotein 3
VNLAVQLYACAIRPDAHTMPPKLPAGLGGALAAELVLAGRIRIDDDTVTVTDATPTGDELVDAVLAGLRQSGGDTVDPARWIGLTGVQVTPRVHDRVIAEGLATQVQGGRSWMAVVRKPDRSELTPAGEEHQRRLRAVLVGDEAPDARTAVLAGLAAACDLVKLLVPREERKAADERAANLADGDAVPATVRTAVKRAQRATASAVLGAQGSIHSR